MSTQTVTPEIAAQQEFLQGILTRSATDLAFRAKLLATPKEAIEAYTGKKITKPLNVVFLESKGRPTLVLPDPVKADGALSEGDLEAVAGGATPVVASVLGIAASLCAIYNAIWD